ncbi:hypothetical protein JM47_03040 [Ureaplasma diversum]|uniref:4'-phosphopantetheinyl transferase domain-containing protein n=1 Tax=Ureaplasma diversum TaxID=42094 RepID=A0A0C5S289_9BACT|nr:4'-phosphopantetheinyl transferase superfamily protein [Ureaplasma diversum]AJQ45520.1 hypothetical protein JM47_03040 [Ureaplasma diversum]
MNIINGIDLVNLTRNEFNDPAFAKRIMVQQEYDHYLELVDQAKVKYVASTFACKEAVMKAFKLTYGYKQIYIKKTEHCRLVYLNGIYQDNLTLSISYADQFVIASLVGFN